MQVSLLESTAKRTPAVCSNSTTARVVFLPLSSKVPAQPTQKRYSKSVSSSPNIGTSMPSRRASSIQVWRSELLRPHGFPLTSRFLNIPVNSEGKLDSASTWKRRKLEMWSMCSISTGHCSTQAPQLVHDHRTSGWMGSVSPTSLSTSMLSCS